MARCGMTDRGWTITLASIYLLLAPLKFEITYFIRDEDEGPIYLTVLNAFFVTFVANALSLPVLIYGAAKGKSKCISQWLIVGAALIAHNLSMVLLLIIHWATHPANVLVKAADAPLAVALWVLASRLATQRRNKELDRRYAGNMQLQKP